MACILHSGNDDDKTTRSALMPWARFLCIIHTHKKRKTKLDKNNCRIRLRVGLTLCNNDTNKRNDVYE